MRQEQQLHSSVRLPFRYALGASASRFFLALKNEKRIYGTRCGGCGQVRVPARSFCPVCCQACTTWVALPDHGTLAGWSETPDLHGYRIALLRLAGADNLLLHRLGGVDDNILEMGMPVVAQWAQLREGKITDIVCFRPAVRREDVA